VKATSVPDAGPQLAPEDLPKKVEEEEEDDDDKTGYGLFIDPMAEEEEKKKLEAKPKKENKEKAAPLKRKFKTLSDLDLWEKVKNGLQVMMIGVNVWGGVVLFMVLIMILGIINGPEYAEVLENSMTVKTQSPAGEIVSPDMPTFMLGLVTGLSYQGIGKIFYILAAVLALFQIIIMMAGYGICLKIPDRFGTLGQVKALLAVAGLNFLLILFFKLLPALGIMNYMLVPYALPEVSMVDANIDRDPPIWVFWSGAPFWEMIVSVLFICSFYAEPILVGILVWSIGMTLREDPVVDKGKTIVAMGFSIGFGLIAFQLLTMAGTSNVALVVIRILYFLWVCFTILLIVRLPIALQATRAILQKYLDGAEMKDDEDEEEEDDKKLKRKRKAKRNEDDDEDDD